VSICGKDNGKSEELMVGDEKQRVEDMFHLSTLSAPFSISFGLFVQRTPFCKRPIPL